jgi:hypothetical protein
LSIRSGSIYRYSRSSTAPSSLISSALLLKRYPSDLLHLWSKMCTLRKLITVSRLKHRENLRLRGRNSKAMGRPCCLSHKNSPRNPGKISKPSFDNRVVKLSFSPSLFWFSTALTDDSTSLDLAATVRWTGKLYPCISQRISARNGLSQHFRIWCARARAMHFMATVLDAVKHGQEVSGLGSKGRKIVCKNSQAAS